MTFELANRSRRRNAQSLERFRKAVRKLQIILTANPNRNRNIAIQFGYNCEDDKQSSELAFDASYFKAKGQRQLSTEVKQTLIKLPEYRTEEDVISALASLRMRVEPFREFPIKMQQSIVRVGWFESFEVGRLIIRQGHRAEQFYLILSGTAVVNVTSKDPETGDKISNDVAYLRNGDSFGELALIHHAKRNASVKCRTDVELLAIDRKDFLAIFVQTTQPPEFLGFLHSLEQLSDWPVNLLPFHDPNICLFTYFRRGNIITHDSVESKWLYVVKSGTCRIIKRMDYSLCLDCSVGNHRNNFIKRTAEQTNCQSCFIQLGKLNAGDIFGLSDLIFKGIFVPLCAALVSDGAECILISKRFFNQHLSEGLRKHLLRTIRPYPSPEALQQQFHLNAEWESFKKVTLMKSIDKIRRKEALGSPR
ncbi:cyclic nucleotide-binding domain-containing protein 2-like isoform X2 [Anneissia japonica]|uniref:cyclic nucleotide-binding domain-containing protein 2-like isoform X2 n=1 Tax=Anneissia japonica TaxID=1529436 RepID=UPI0014255175|nr:cyclic nucleotide-binding domain-containing protein 2-like isoform X2 [Anneissia japonica]